MIKTNLPVFFNTYLHKKLGPELLEKVKETIKEDTEGAYLTLFSPAGKLFSKLKKDKDICFVGVLETAPKVNETDKSGLLTKIEGLYGKIIYDYYRENTFADSEIGNKRADVYLKEAADIIKKVQEDSFVSWIKAFEGVIETAEISTQGNIIKIGKKDSKVVLKFGDTPDLVQKKFTQIFDNLMKSHLSFIPVKEKIKALNMLFKQIKSLRTTKELKQYMLIYFYDLVYAISITSNFVSFEEAQKIISELN